MVKAIVSEYTPQQSAVSTPVTVLAEAEAAPGLIKKFVPFRI
jgi:hypothetical protein